MTKDKDSPDDGDVSKHSKVRLVTVEPLTFAFIFGQFLSFPTTSALTYKKSCLVEFNGTFCDLMANKTYQDVHRAEQDAIQDEASYWTMIQQITIAAPATLVVFFFMASWGDKVDRKIPILLPILGGLLCNGINFMSAYYMDLDIRILLVGTLINGFLGPFVTFLMGIYTYIAAVAPPENKTVRVGIVEAAVYLAGGTSVFVSGLIRKQIGFTGVYVIVLACQVAALFYCVVFLQSVRPVKSKDLETNNSNTRCFGAVTDMIAFIRRKREGKTNLYIWLYIILLNFVAMGSAGESDILYLFLRRAPRSLDGVEYGYFKGTESFSRSLALIVLLPILKHVFKWRDTSVMMIGVMFKGIQFVILGFARTLTVAFIALIFATLQGFPSAAVRSSLSGLVDDNESGLLFGLLAVTEGITSLTASFFFNGLYPKTFDFFDGILFECIAVFCLIAFLIAIFLRRRKSDLMDPPVTESDSGTDGIGDQKQAVDTNF